MLLVVLVLRYRWAGAILRVLYATARVHLTLSIALHFCEFEYGRTPKSRRAVDPLGTGVPRSKGTAPPPRTSIGP